MSTYCTSLCSHKYVVNMFYSSGKPPSSRVDPTTAFSLQLHSAALLHKLIILKNPAASRSPNKARDSFFCIPAFHCDLLKARLFLFSTPFSRVLVGFLTVSPVYTVLYLTIMVPISGRQGFRFPRIQPCLCIGKSIILQV